MSLPEPTPLPPAPLLACPPFQAWELVATTLKKNGVTFVTPAQVGGGHVSWVDACLCGWHFFRVIFAGRRVP